MATPLWARLDSRHLVTLSEVARCGSFTAAATSLGYTQSAVSQQIARLERIVGHALVDRLPGGRSVSLTPAGRVVLQHADVVAATVQRAAADIAALDQGMAGTLRIGCFESVGTGLLPDALAIFYETFDRVQVVLSELPDDGDLLDRLGRDELDLSFVVYPLAPGPFESAALLEDPYVLLVAEDSPMATVTGAVDLDDYPELPLVGYGEMRAVHSIEARLGRPSYGSRIVFRSNQNSTIVSLVQRGHVAAVLPRLSVVPLPPGLRTVELRRVSPRVVGLAWHRHRPVSEAAAGFIRAVEEVVEA
ncbi:LysR family transcriptional regulator [Solicola sp. PLA-1-18]|uniref:LysR family transcriptional regulator n=1 Tax=Solicola sp. PLA-1-18 TaxID=3380532 RepID=UPI003B7F9696